MRRGNPQSCESIAVLILGMLTTALSGQDWPQWRGPARDGVAVRASRDFSRPGLLRKEWEITVGEGHASPVIVQGRVYIHSREGDLEVLRCVSLADGKVNWQSSSQAPYEMHTAAREHGKGPKSTPVVRDGLVFTFSIHGVLTCWDANSGERRWRREFSKQFPLTSPLYGTAMSPLVHNGLLIAHVGGHDKGALIALAVASGETRWSNDMDGPGYASPIVAELAGKKQLVTQTQSHVVGLDVENGKLLWKIPFKTDYDQNSITLVQYQDLIIYSGVSQPLTAIRLDQRAGRITPQEVWSNDSHPLYLSSPVLRNNLLFGMSHRKSGQLFCVDAATGKTLWVNDGRVGENAALICLDDTVLALSHTGDSLFFKASATRYERVHSQRVSDSHTWAHPALAGNRILIKNRTNLASWLVGE